MVSLEKFKLLLGKAAETLTDTQVQQLRDEQYQLAELAFNSWVETKGLKNTNVVKQKAM